MQGWLGTWKIERFGTLSLTSLTYKHDDTLTNFAGGHDFWGVSGSWTDPRAARFKFDGGFDARDHLVLTAGVDTPDAPDDDDIYLFRDGDTIEHGYWTHYVVGKPPQHHHPWNGKLERRSGGSASASPRTTATATPTRRASARAAPGRSSGSTSRARTPVGRRSARSGSS